MSDDALRLFSKQTAVWFSETFGEPTAVQKEAWPAIAAGGPVLVSAPTGTGKTLSAFLVFLDRLRGMAERDELEEQLYLIYVSPLKSLAADIRENLERPLKGISSQKKDSSPAGARAISAGIRTGDTTQRERQRMIKHPPHILITTPESLYLMLTSRSGQEILRSARAVIIDELHALIDSKRGAHLLLSIARLDGLCGRKLQRIGLSATIRPLALAAEWLSPEGAAIVAPPMEKKMEIRVTGCVPAADGRKNPLWEELARMVYERCRGRRSVIAFLEGRRYAEKLAWFVNQLGGEGFARVHHGSLSKEQRQETEAALREGRLRLLCATSSMELGIDVGEVDEVLQIGCPRTVSSTMQRLGRAGHNPGRVSEMYLYPRTAPEGILCGMTAVLAKRGGVEEACPPRQCLDVLAQHLVSMAASGPAAGTAAYRVDDVMELLKRAWPFREVERETVKRVLSMLAGEYEHRQEIPARPRVIYDPLREEVYGDAYSRMLAVAAGGTIPDKGMFAARTPEGVKVGELDEEFVYESRIGDRFLLGAFGWKIVGQDRDTVFVERSEAQGDRLTFWKGEIRGRGLKTSLAFGKMMGQLGRAKEEERKGLLKRMGLDDAAAESGAELIRRQMKATKALPDDQTVIAEHFRDHTGRWQVMFHAPFGRRVLAPLCLLALYTLRKKFGIEAGGVEEEEGFLLYGYGEEPLPEGILMSIDPDTALQALQSLLLQTPLFGMTFRYNAGRALMLGMKQNRRQPLWAQRLKGAQLLDRAVKEKDHPLVEETIRECLEDQWDLEGLSWFFSSLHAGLIAVRELETQVPSPLSLPLQWQTEAAEMYSYSPVTQGVRQQVFHGLEELEGREGRRGVEPSREALEKEQERKRLPQDSLQLYALLQTEGDLAAGDLEIEAGWLRQLDEEGKAVYREPGLWIAAEQAPEYETALSKEETEESLDAAAGILRRMLYYRGPKRKEQIRARYGFRPERAEAVLERLGNALIEENGLYYHAKRYDRAVRATVMAKRQEIRTQPSARYAALMARTAFGRGDGKSRLREALERYEDRALPAAWWEEIVFPARSNGYQPAWLDAALAEGELYWQLSPEGELRFLKAEETDWDADDGWLEEGRQRCDTEEERLVYEELIRRGASFLRPLSACLKGESAQEPLLALAQKGLVCADSFVPVRQWLNREKLAKAPVRQRVGARVMALSSGRWDLVRPTKPFRPERWLEKLLSEHFILCRETFRKPSFDPENAQDGRAFSWADALRILGVWEYAGKVRRGYFVEGLSGAQFVRAEDYGAVMQALAAPEPEICWLNAADPAQVWGKCLPHEEGRAFANVPFTAVALKEGRPVALLERKGRILRALEEESPERPSAESARGDIWEEALLRLAEAFRSGRLFPSLKRLVVKEYPGFAADAWKKAGFRREMQDYVLYR